MPKVILVTDDIVTLGMENGTLKEVHLSNLNFQPQVGDKVEIFETAERVVVSKIRRSSLEPSSKDADGAVHVNKLVYCLLAILLGSIGAHKFYAKKIVLGVIYLLFCWTGIPAIIGLIEGIIALCKDSDDDGNISV